MIINYEPHDIHIGMDIFYWVVYWKDEKGKRYLRVFGKGKREEAKAFKEQLTQLKEMQR